MPLTSNIAAYTDVKAVLDTALEAGGGTYELESPAQAAHWRHRAYKFRSLLSDNNPYAGVTLRIVGNSVLIDLIQPTGTFIGPDGKKHKVDESVELELESDDDMLAEATKLVEELGE